MNLIDQFQKELNQLKCKPKNIKKFISSKNKSKQIFLKVNPLKNEKIYNSLKPDWNTKKQFNSNLLIRNSTLLTKQSEIKNRFTQEMQESKNLQGPIKQQDKNNFLHKRLSIQFPLNDYSSQYESQRSKSESLRKSIKCINKKLKYSNFEQILKKQKIENPEASETFQNEFKDSDIFSLPFLIKIPANIQKVQENQKQVKNISQIQSKRQQSQQKCLFRQSFLQKTEQGKMTEKQLLLQKQMLKEQKVGKKDAKNSTNPFLRIKAKRTLQKRQFSSMSKLIKATKIISISQYIQSLKKQNSSA